MASTKKPRETGEPGRVSDIQATEMLREDHRKVKRIFDEFESSEESSAKKSLVEQALIELMIHTMLEEELFYPTVRRETEDEDLLDEALEGHHVAKLLIGELVSMNAGDPRYEAKFLVLAESVRRHMEEEEGEMLPKIERSGFDLETLGRQMAERKMLLQQQVTRDSIAEELSGEARPRKRPVSAARSGGMRGRSSRRVGRKSRSRSQKSRKSAAGTRS